MCCSSLTTFSVSLRPVLRSVCSSWPYSLPLSGYQPTLCHRYGYYAGAYYHHQEGIHYLRLGALFTCPLSDSDRILLPPPLLLTWMPPLYCLAVSLELGIYPAVDPLDSKSRMLDPRIVGEEHYNIATGVQKILQNPTSPLQRYHCHSWYGRTI